LEVVVRIVPRLVKEARLKAGGCQPCLAQEPRPDDAFFGAESRDRFAKSSDHSSNMRKAFPQCLGGIREARIAGAGTKRQDMVGRSNVKDVRVRWCLMRCSALTKTLEQWLQRFSTAFLGDMVSKSNFWMNIAQYVINEPAAKARIVG
jgi:hypothetical protein